MKRICLSLLLVLAVSAQAQNAEPVVAPAAEPEAVVAAEAVVAVEPAEPVDLIVVADADAEAAKPLSDRHCLRHTGSHIAARRNRDGCVNATGRAYDSEEIHRTGANTLAEALDRLDTSVTVRR